MIKEWFVRGIGKRRFFFNRTVFDNRRRFLILLILFNSLLISIALLSIRNVEVRQEIRREEILIRRAWDLHLARRVPVVEYRYVTATPTPQTVPLAIGGSPSISPSATATSPLATPSEIPIESSIPTSTPSPSSTFTATFTPSPTPSSTPKSTPTPTSTSTPTPPIFSPTPSPTSITTYTPTPTTIPRVTSTPTSTPAPTPTPTYTPTSTPASTSTATPIPTSTATFTPIPTPTEVVVIFLAKYNKQIETLIVKARTNLPGCTLTLADFGPMEPEGNHWRYMEENLQEKDVPSTVTVLSSSGGWHTSYVQWDD